MTEAERRDIMKVVESCERYWLETSVPSDKVDEMKAELTAHLTAAASEGKSPETVVGRDVTGFAESWASVYREPRRPTGRPSIIKSSGGMIVGAVAVGAVIVAALLGPKEDAVDTEIWRWIWVGSALFLGVAEMVTAGFFLLPFAIGAVAAAALAWLNVAVPVQLLVFIVVSVLSLIVIQRWARRDDDIQASVGANRYLAQTATVTEPIDRALGTGRIRMETEDWRAVSDIAAHIEAGQEVRVIGVRGTRLIVEPVDGGSR